MPNRILTIDDDASVRRRVRTRLEIQPGFATLKDGVLNIGLPKAAHAKAVRIGPTAA